MTKDPALVACFGTSLLFLVMLIIWTAVMRS